METITGLRMTGEICSHCNFKLLLLYIYFLVHSFLGLVRYVFSLPGMIENKIAFLSRNLCQDPLENFFGCQRQRGGTSDNPNASEFQFNTQALRVVNSFCRGPIRGNCRGSTCDVPLDTTPLKKRHHVRRHSI